MRVNVEFAVRRLPKIEARSALQTEYDFVAVGT
jgi:hypothetical protein